MRKEQTPVPESTGSHEEDLEEAINTLASANARNMFARKLPQTEVKMPPNALPPPHKVYTIPLENNVKAPVFDMKEEEPPSPERPPHHRHRSVPPRELYFSNGYMPKLADLRDAMRNNQIFHSRFNPVLELPETKKYYAAALKLQEGEEEGFVDEGIEDRDVLDILIPGAQGKEDDLLDRLKAR